MKCLRVFALVATAAITLAANQTQAQNLLTNPGFEDPITADGPPFVGFWEAFQGGGASAIRDTTMPRSGAGHLALAINNANNTFAGAFQDVPSLNAGMPLLFSVWHKTQSLPYDLVTEMRIEWRNTGANTEISRTVNLTTSPTGDYSQLSVFATVPAGADTARVVYAIQSFTNGALPDTGTVYVDDASVSIVPEPSTLVLIGLSCVAAAALRRRRP